MLERLAAALGIKSNELFSVAISPERAIEALQRAVLENMDHSIEKALNKAFEKQCIGCPSAKVNKGTPTKKSG